MIYDLSSVTASDIGIYTMRISFKIGTIQKSQTMLVQIYPETEYTANVETFECHDQPLTKFYKTPGYIYNAFAIDSRYVVCGAHMNSMPNAKYLSFIQVIAGGGEHLYR